MRASLTTAVIACTLVGVLGGAVCPGAGLLWGLGYALLLWLAGPAGVFPLLGDTHAMGMLDTARAHFPELIAYVLCFGLPLGLTLGVWGSRRLGLRQVDGADQLLPDHRRPGQLQLSRGRHCAAFRDRDCDRDELRAAVPARRARLWIEHGLGDGLRSVLVVPGSTHAAAAPAGQSVGLVIYARECAVRLAHRPYRLRPDPGADLRGARSAVGRVLDRIRSNQPRSRRARNDDAAVVRLGRGGEPGGRVAV